MRKILIIAPITLYLVASTWANLDLFPQGFMEYWWFDDVMHVLVFGAVGFSLGLLFQTYCQKWWLGICLALVLAAADELTQLVIPARAVSLHDFLMSTLGISVVTMGFLVHQLYRRRS